MYVISGSGIPLDHFTTYFPIQGYLNVTCNVTDQVPLWRVNDVTYTSNQLDNGDLPGHNHVTIGSNSILISDSPVNSTKYVCFVIQDGLDILSDSVIINVAGKPLVIVFFAALIKLCIFS